MGLHRLAAYQVGWNSFVGEETRAALKSIYAALSVAQCRFGPAREKDSGNSMDDRQTSGRKPDQTVRPRIRFWIQLRPRFESLSRLVRSIDPFQIVSVTAVPLASVRGNAEPHNGQYMRVVGRVRQIYAATEKFFVPTT
jgi:hypothetical protein